ncbi:MAG: type-F conjugative transfer system pilin assembly thiol-disulfide isomerase TrbB, partial [Ketobacter sp.]|nr:type-F conjugative transfer system pilin assembly thiol-disulfide isomerase TrbB [Ketobacter sp.]
APKVQQASLDFALPIYAFSINGQGIPGFEVPILVTHDIATTFFPQTTQPVMPATFLLNVNSRKFAKLSIGDVAQRQLNQSIQQVLNDLTLQKALQ